MIERFLIFFIEFYIKMFLFNLHLEFILSNNIP